MLNDEPILLPEEIATAIDKSPRYRPREPAVKPKAYANPNGPGYGGGETPWPFDVKRAYVDGRYRAGVRNAMNADWTASNWKAATRAALRVILEDLLAAEDVVEDIVQEERVQKRAAAKRRQVQLTQATRDRMRPVYEQQFRALLDEGEIDEAGNWEMYARRY